MYIYVPLLRTITYETGQVRQKNPAAKCYRVFSYGGETTEDRGRRISVMDIKSFFRQDGEVVTSRQNPFVKELCSLSEKKYRERLGLFRFDGLKLFEEAILSDVPFTAIAVCESALPFVEKRIAESFGNRLKGRTLPRECRVRILSDGVFDKISEEKSPEGMICVAKALDKIHKMTTINNIPENLSTLGDGKRSPKLLFLSEVRDPGNVGTVLRTAAAFGVDCVLLSKDCADLYFPRTLRAAMGAIFRLPTLRIDGRAEDAVRALCGMGRSVYATALDASARPLGSFDVKTTDVFVVGNEGHGLSDELIKAATGSVYIPMTPGSESLNAAIAATVCMWELRGGESPADRDGEC